MVWYMNEKQINTADANIDTNLTLYNLNEKALSIKNTYLLRKSIEALIEFVGSTKLHKQSA